MIPSSDIRAIVDNMKKSSHQYDEKAFSIWNMLEKEEQDQLVHILTSRFGVFDGPIVKDPVRTKLIEAGLATRSVRGNEEGYTVGTFIGYAVWSSGKAKDPNVTLPGEKKS